MTKLEDRVKCDKEKDLRLDKITKEQRQIATLAFREKEEGKFK